MDSQKKDGIIASLAVYAAIVLVCALIAGGIGAFWHVILNQAHRPSSRHRRRQQREMVSEVQMTDTSEDMKFRFFVGAAIGSVVGVGACVGLNKKMKDV